MAAQLPTAGDPRHDDHVVTINGPLLERPRKFTKLDLENQSVWDGKARKMFEEAGCEGEQLRDMRFHLMAPDGAGDTLAMNGEEFRNAVEFGLRRGAMSSDLGLDLVLTAEASKRPRATTEDSGPDEAAASKSETKTTSNYEAVKDICMRFTPKICKVIEQLPLTEDGEAALAKTMADVIPGYYVLKKHVVALKKALAKVRRREPPPNAKAEQCVPKDGSARHRAHSATIQSIQYCCMYHTSRGMLYQPAQDHPEPMAALFWSPDSCQHCAGPPGQHPPLDGSQDQQSHQCERAAGHMV